MIEKIITESSLSKQHNLFLSPSQGHNISARYAEGQLLEGQVIEVLGERHFLIDFKGFKVVGESAVPLNTGQYIQVKVVQTAPQVVLNLVMESVEEQKALCLLRSYLPSSTSWADLMQCCLLQVLIGAEEILRAVHRVG